MSRTSDNLVTLCDRLAAHQGVMHWAISMRVFEKGDFFANLKSGKRRGCHTETAERAFQWFSDHWPADLEWPQDIPRPSLSKTERKAS